MLSEQPLFLSQTLLSLLDTQVSIQDGDRIPTSGPVLFVSNHRSFMDALLLMVVANRSIRFACHRYMSQVPLLREVTAQLGCLPLRADARGQQEFFRQATQLLQRQQAVGIFPEGASAMVEVGQPSQVGSFQRGFAHLALQANTPDLKILPIAIASQQETCQPLFPLQLLSWFDPSEPLFQQAGWHSMVIYRRVKVLVGQPLPVSAIEQDSYRGSSKAIARDLSERCQQSIQALLAEGYA
ncbi:MAG: 1-acyl-sn-glycerol-3-phosphate acyltransferase [Aphanocapsa sp. GSE-SYN-MK-11-07L]|jgi:1-acyl-sn-glycerol-3-phosphate acyltransferase|nr:1-acyl-sn-glycerol-3-phosphate acyltransferase [Aphanocapsa sp. GSE-SYN-MK-11-07L]